MEEWNHAVKKLDKERKINRVQENISEKKAGIYWEFKEITENLAYVHEELSFKSDKLIQENQEIWSIILPSDCHNHLILSVFIKFLQQ